MTIALVKIITRSSKIRYNKMELLESTLISRIKFENLWVKKASGKLKTIHFNPTDVNLAHKLKSGQECNPLIRSALGRKR